MFRNQKKYRNTCDEFRDRVGTFREGILDEPDHLRLEAHRIECTGCRKALKEEERVALMMAEVPKVDVAPDFRDRVLRAWRLKRDRVKEQVPVQLLNRLQIGMAVAAVILLTLPVVRVSLFTSASRLTSAVDNLPPELREGIRISFSIPTWAEIQAYFQLWQGQIFEGLGNLGSVLAPWQAWIWTGLVLSLLLAVGSVWRFRSAVAVEKQERR